jgi:hypothetical protein
LFWSRALVEARPLVFEYGLVHDFRVFLESGAGSFCFMEVYQMALLSRLFGRSGEADRDGIQAGEGKASTAMAQGGRVEAVGGITEPVYRALGLTIVPAGTDEAVIKATGQPPVLVSRFAAECLVRCDSFRTLADHAGCIASELRLGPAERGEMYRELGRLAEAGLLTPLEAWAPAPAEQPQEASVVDSLVLVSANRAASSGLCLESFIGNARSFGRNPEWVLYDDSIDPAVRKGYRQMLAQVGSKAGNSILYAGLEEKQAFADALAAEGLDREVVDFCLFGVAVQGNHYGANRNAMFLDMNGRVMVSQDDDTFCETGLLPDDCGPATDPERACLATGDASVFSYFGTVGEARTAPERMELDYLGLHEKVLGQNARQLLACPGSGVEAAATEAADRLVRSVLSGKGRIMATQMGIAGDSGMGSTFYYLQAKGASRENLLADEDLFRSYMTSRAVVRRVPSVTLNDNPAFMTYAVGFDCRELLPPFVPMLRNSDALFGSMLSLLQPDGLFGLLPWTIGHEPPEARFSDEASRLRNVTGIGAADYLAMLCRIWPAAIAAGLPVEARFRSLGRHLVDVGKLPTGELEELLGSLYVRDKARLLGMLEGLLEEFGGQPEFWAVEVRAAVKAIAEALPRRESVMPGDLGGSDCEARLGVFSTLVRRYGELLLAWPDIISATTSLRSREIRIASRG